jgi:hypothetical protein
MEEDVFKKLSIVALIPVAVKEKPRDKLNFAPEEIGID